MSWNVTSVAPSGSGTVAHFTTLPSRRSISPLTGSRPSIAVTVTRSAGQTGLSPASAWHQPITASICGRSCKRRRIELPHLREHRIEQPQPAVAREHRDAFRQVVEGLALHADQRLEAALEIERLGDVVVEIDHAAFRIGRGDDAQRAAVGQVPFVLPASVAR